MATRIYLPSTGTALVTPSTWNFANQINPLTLKGVRTKITSSVLSKVEATGTTSPTARAMFRWVIGPLAAQTIDGTVKGQMQGLESNAGANATIAIAIKIVQPGGADRAVLLAQTAPDTTTTPPEFATTSTNRSFRNSSEVAAIPLTSQVATAGDYLVIEVGFRSATTTTRNITLRYGDEFGSDLLENETQTTNGDPWIEFSDDIILRHNATIAATAGAATGSTLAQHVALFTAAIVGAAAPSTSNVSATSADPVYTAAVAGSMGAATASATATFGGGTQAATIAGTAAAATASVSAAFGGTRTAVVAGTVGAATSSVVARGVEHPDGVFTQWHYGIFGTRYGAFSLPPTLHTITITAVVGTTTAAAVVTRTAPTYGCSASGSMGAATAAVVGHQVAYVAGTFTQWHFGIFGRRYGALSVPSTYSGTIVATAGAATASASATFAPGTKTTVISETIGAATASTTATFSGGVHTATISGTARAAASAVATTFSGGLKTASITGAMGPATGAITASFGPGTHTTAIHVSIAPVFASVETTFLGLTAAAIAALVGPATAQVLMQFVALPTTFREGVKSYYAPHRKAYFKAARRRTTFKVLN